VVRYKPIAFAIGGEMEKSVIEDVEEIDTIIAELEISKGKGNLILCVVNSPAYRDRIIQTLQGRFLSEVIYVEKGEEVIRNLKSRDFDGADILIWVMPEEPTEDLLNTLNNFRELFYEVMVPNLVFYNRAFSENVIRKAPDFWRYRGNYYELKEAERGMAFEVLETLATPFFYQDKEDLLRRKRINKYLLEKIRDKEEKAKILTELGMIFYYSGELEKALEYFEKALKLAEELGIKEVIAADRGNIGTTYLTRGELDKALEYFRKALKLYEELGIKEGIATDLENIGIVYLTKGDLNKALKYYENALKLDEELGIKEGIATVLVNVGIVYRIKGELEKALEYFEKALKLAEELGIKEVIATDLENIGSIYLARGELDKALEYYEKALKLGNKLGIKEGKAIVLGNIGNVYATKGELDKALEYFEKALKIFKDMGSRIKTAQILMNIGSVFLMKGDKACAVDYYLKAESLAVGSLFFEKVRKMIKLLREEQNAKNTQHNTKGI
jgi:tetratricopeptide (TPR) repeat protein